MRDRRRDQILKVLLSQLGHRQVTFETDINRFVLHSTSSKCLQQPQDVERNGCRSTGDRAKATIRSQEGSFLCSLEFLPHFGFVD